MNIEDYISKCVKLIVKLEEQFLDPKDKKASKYNSTLKQLRKLEEEINQKSVYKDIYRQVLEKTNESKFRHLHYDIAASLYNVDKLFSLEIYKLHKGRAMADSRIEDLEQELIEEGKLPKKGLLSKLFK